MSLPLPSFRTDYGTPIGVELFFKFPNISKNEKTYLDTDQAAASSSISANGTNFSVGQYVVIGRPGNEHSEIIRIHASTTPTSSTITFASNTVFAHNRGDLVTFIPYNQIEPARSTDSGSNFSALTAIAIRADSTETYLQRASDASTDVYKFRFYNSADVTYSAYSSNTTASGFADNSVYSLKQRALQDLGESIGGKITDKFLTDSILEARRTVDQDPRVIRWSFRTSFNTDIGTIIPGRYTVSAPSDLRDPNTYKNILALRIGRKSYPLDYQDKIRYNENFENIAHTTLNGAIVTADTSITLTSSGDFDESGSIIVASEAVNTDMDTVAYTANNESTNVISGVTGIQAAGHATGRDVWQGANFGTPTAYTIDNGTIYFDIPFENDLDGENIYMDYYKTLPTKVYDSDTMDEPEYDFYVSYLKWKIKNQKANGKLKIKDDSDYLDFLRGVNAMVTKETTGQTAYLEPEIM